MSQPKRKFNKIGAIWEKKDHSGLFIKLGTQNKNKPEYDISVEVVVRDANGEVIHKQTDGFLTVVDPRKQAEERGDERALAGLDKVPGLQFEILAANE